MADPKCNLVSKVWFLRLSLYCSSIDKNKRMNLLDSLMNSFRGSHTTNMHKISRIFDLMRIAPVPEVGPPLHRVVLLLRIVDMRYMQPTTLKALKVPSAATLLGHIPHMSTSCKRTSLRYQQYFRLEYVLRWRTAHFRFSLDSIVPNTEIQHTGPYR